MRRAGCTGSRPVPRSNSGHERQLTASHENAVGSPAQIGNVEFSLVRRSPSNSLTWALQAPHIVASSTPSRIFARKRLRSAKGGGHGSDDRPGGGSRCPSGHRGGDGPGAERGRRSSDADGDVRHDDRRPAGAARVAAGVCGHACRAREHRHLLAAGVLRLGGRVHAVVDQHAGA